jgi:hypothetical protein
MQTDESGLKAMIKFSAQAGTHDQSGPHDLSGRVQDKNVVIGLKAMVNFSGQVDNYL